MARVLKLKGISQFYLHTPRSSANRMNHICLLLKAYFGKGSHSPMAIHSSPRNIVLDDAMAIYNCLCLVRLVTDQQGDRSKTGHHNIRQAADL